ncbi:MAG: PD40 domain-containing protein [Planctomycetes bacterium]|nr:PD40 domain-containing protein [Planctomycetota bacterium]
MRTYALSPDGRRAALAWERDGRVRLYLMPVGGGWPSLISDMDISADEEGAIAFSPDGKRAYVVNDLGNSVTVLE